MDARHAPGEPRLLISRAALRQNVRALRRHVPAGVRVCAIVKADAYGLGAAGVVDALCNFADPYSVSTAPVVDELAVATIDEAAAIEDVAAVPFQPLSPGKGRGANAWRRAHFANGPMAIGPSVDDAQDEATDGERDDDDRQDDESGADGSPRRLRALPILVLRPVENAFVGLERHRLERAVRSGWSLTVCSRAAADDLARVAVACGRRAAVQVLVDTGMTRGGVAPKHLDDLVRKIESHPSLRLAGLFSHFAHGEANDHAQTRAQLAAFRAATDGHAERLGGRLTRHLSNSGGTFFAPAAAALDMVRPGIGIYGIDPTGRPSVDRPLRPAMTWLAPLVDVRDVPAGTAVGYNGTWVSDRATRVGLVPVGYADGYPRALSGRGVTLVNGVKCPVVGRVSMDLLTVDLHDAPHAVVGDDVTLLDPDPLSPASVYELARLADTIPYEILCRIGPRVRRAYVDPAEG